MSGELPGFDPEVLRTATAAFGDAADGLSRMRADEVVGNAGASLGQLLTAESCRRAQEGITAAVTAAVESVREYSDLLDDAVRAYSRQDQAVAGDIANVDIPS
ncbi:type VII secretion target [Mycolicibacterium gadium]|uniref:ESX-1 secretion-associated protein n=1 Tax=Mycolicibacterium gadium TaxID=1794 RepID=A0A7I7WTT5_MYCGU|nr:type VII secretion target [Mycolicibacterium gadium]BBZ19853.1 hypothetical protein MGAD_41880 [Mycolicibacterium gadium]